VLFAARPVSGTRIGPSFSTLVTLMKNSPSPSPSALNFIVALRSK